MIHNTFDIIPFDDGYKTKSHNFPEFEGEGKTITEAIDNLQRKIVYYADNFPKEFRKRIYSRIKRGLECECGVRLTEPSLGFYTPPNLVIKH